MSQKLRRWFVCMEQGALVGNRVRLLRNFSNTQHHSAITKAIHQKITEQPNAVLRMRACGHSLASFLHRCCRTAVHKTASKRSLPIQLDHADLLPGGASIAGIEVQRQGGRAQALTIRSLRFRCIHFRYLHFSSFRYRVHSESGFMHTFLKHSVPICAE